MKPKPTWRNTLDSTAGGNALKRWNTVVDLMWAVVNNGYWYGAWQGEIFGYEQKTRNGMVVDIDIQTTGLTVEDIDNG